MTIYRSINPYSEAVNKTLKYCPAFPERFGSRQDAASFCEKFFTHYNHVRHRSLAGRSTPAVAYMARPKAIPGDRTSDAHSRIRRDRVDEGGSISLRINGRLIHVGVGRTLARTPVLLLIHDLDVRVVNAATGELIRTLTVDPNRSYQGTGAPKGPTRK